MCPLRKHVGDLPHYVIVIQVKCVCVMASSVTKYLRNVKRRPDNGYVNIDPMWILE